MFHLKFRTLIQITTQSIKSRITLKPHRVTFDFPELNFFFTTSIKKMTEVASNHQPGNLLDLGAFVGELTVEDDLPSDDISLEGLEQELQDCKTDDVVATILSKGTKLRDYTKDVENNLRQIELDSIEVGAVAVLCVQGEASYRPLITDILHSLVPLVPLHLGGTLRDIATISTI